MNSVNSVWLIDDDKIYLFAMKRIMETLHMADKIYSYQNGSEAIEALVNKDEVEWPNLIMVDINMPVMDGWEFMTKYQEITAQKEGKPRIYMVSSSIDEADISRAQKIQALNGYLIKPIDKTQLEEVVASCTI